MSRYARATLVSLQTADALVQMNDGVPLGRVYRVDLQSETALGWLHLPTGRSVSRPSILVVDEGGEAWMPTEILQIERLEVAS